MGQKRTVGFAASYFDGILLSGMSKSNLKKVFSSDIGVEPSNQVLDILEYACGLILGLALISNENPNFENASSRFRVNEKSLLF